jgi:dipeptidase
MCDTMAARASATATGATLFAKNSDRDPNEAQFLQILPAQRYGRGAVLRTTYLAIPQAARTHAVLLSRPFWIWGAEMGANEHGVAIGNEAVHPRAQPQCKPALLGMDLLRLGLERGATAAEAVEVITSLLEQHGQGGNCRHRARGYYDNSFIIADAREIFVLETVGRHWAVERAGPARSISNTYTIGTEIIRASHELEALARKRGWWSGETFDFAAAVTDPGNPGLSVARTRCARSTTLLQAEAGHLTAAHMMKFLRDHGGADDAGWHPQDIVGGTICMHAADGTRRGQSVGSLVSDLRKDGAVHWVTGTSAPCTGIFKPVFIEDGLPDQGPIPGALFDAETLWWRHESLHRALLTDYAAMNEIAAERAALEARFAAGVESLIATPGAQRRAAVAQCWRDAAEAEAGWLRRLQGRSRLRPGYRASWQRRDRLAGATLTCAAMQPALAAE